MYAGQVWHHRNSAKHRIRTRERPDGVTAAAFAVINASFLVQWSNPLWEAAGCDAVTEDAQILRRVLAVDAARQTLTGPVVTGLLGGLFAALSLLLMLLYDLRLAVFGLAFAALAIAALALTARLQAGPLQRLYDAEGRTFGTIVSLLSGIARLRVAGAEERAFDQWAAGFRQRQEAAWRSGRIAAFRSALLLALPSCGLLGMFLVAALRPVPIDLAAFAAFSAAFAQFLAGLAALGLALTQAVETLPLLRRALPVLTAQPEAPAPG